MLNIEQFDWDTLDVKLGENNNPVNFQKIGSSFDASEQKTSFSVSDLEFNDNWIAVLGDIHSNVAALKIAVEACKRVNIKHCFQVGDFGYLFDDKYNASDQLMDNILGQARDEFDFQLHVIDGNHDNHRIWHRDRLEAKEFKPYKVSDSAQWLYHPRGSVFELKTEGGFDTSGLTYQPKTTTLGFIGGARSVNVLPYEEEAIADNGWWHDEEPTDDDVFAFIENVKKSNGVDIMFGHDAPATYYLKKGMILSTDMEHLSSRTRSRLDYALVNTDPKLYMHGHWHQLAHVLHKQTKVMCLSQEYRYGNLVFVNLDSYEVVVPEIYGGYDMKNNMGTVRRIQ